MVAATIPEKSTTQANVDGRATNVDPFGTIASDFRPEPRQFGAYRILHPIAGGSMGQVFCAINDATGDQVALKLVRRPTLECTERNHNFFLREMSILSRLNHPRIIGIRDFGSFDGQLYLAMEYIKTINLRHELTLCPTSQQIRLVCGVGCYMLSGLAHAHAQNIVHRDIKPANVLVYRNTQRGGRIGIKLADFGLSKDTRNAGLSGMTCEGEIRGTPAFMAPEHFRNSRDVGPSGDVYSTAAVLYFLLTGVTPHQVAQDAPLKICKIIEGATVPLAKRRDDLPPRLCDVIDRGLATIEAGRYQSAVEFNQALLPFTRKQGA